MMPKKTRNTCFNVSGKKKLWEVAAVSAFYVILAIVLAIAVIALYQSWRKQREWQGTVTKIEEIPAAGIDGLDVKDYTIIHYRIDGGGEKRLRLQKAKYERLFPGLREGDRLIKEAGAPFPRRYV